MEVEVSSGVQGKVWGDGRASRVATWWRLEPGAWTTSWEQSRARESESSPAGVQKPGEGEEAPAGGETQYRHWSSPRATDLAM